MSSASRRHFWANRKDDYSRWRKKKLTRITSRKSLCLVYCRSLPVASVHSSQNDIRVIVIVFSSCCQCWVRKLFFFVRRDPIRFMAGYRKRRLDQVQCGFVRFSCFDLLCLSFGCCRFDLSVRSPSDCLQKSVPEMTCYVACRVGR